VIVPVGAKGGFVPSGCRPGTTARRSRPRASPATRCSSRPARPDRQHRRRAWCRRRRRPCARRRRSLSGGRRRQGHGDLLRHRQRHRRRLRLLARRRVRLRRLGRLRPQEDGHHRARRLGVGQAPLPRMGVDIQTEPFTVVGIGDMSGDVFGNGMLLSKRSGWSPPSTTATSSSTRPGPAASFAERQRLFDLPRSSWADYDKVADLQGRRRLPAHAEVDPLSPEVRPLLGLRPTALTPDELIRASSRPGRPALERRHRHLCEGPARATPTSATGQRRGPRQRRRAALQGGRRGRQPRRHPGGRIEYALRRRPHQHRLHRQFRRRRHLRPRGQHQDPART
jgi:hypothetical protein